MLSYPSCDLSVTALFQSGKAEQFLRMPISTMEELFIFCGRHIYARRSKNYR